MGLFGGIGKALKGIDWDRISTGLQTAGAVAQGDFGTAAQIQALNRRQRDEEAEAQSKTQQAEMQVAALVRQGIPEPDARAIVATGAADTVMGQRFGQQADSEFTRTLRAAGVDPASPEGQQMYRQRAASMATNPVQGQWTGTPETGYTFRANPTSGPPMGMPQQTAPQGPPQPGQVVNGYRFKGGNPNDPNSWEPAGGAGSNVGGGFRPSRYGWKFP